MATLKGSTIEAGGRTWRVMQEHADEARGLASLVLIPIDEVVHQCPPSSESLTPCCGRSPFDLPRHHRITVEGFVTCEGPTSSDAGRPNG